jgi:phosphotransferase system HPr-like phosphotransfer protein
LRDKIREVAPHELRRRFISRLLKDAQVLRTVLNEHDAQENRTFSFLTEIVAGIRRFANVSYILIHLKERFRRSPFEEIEPLRTDFLKEISKTLTCCDRTLKTLFTAILSEFERLALELPPPDPIDGEDGYGAPPVRRRLPHNVDEDGSIGEGEMMAQVAASFLKAQETYESLVPPKLETYDSLREYVMSTLDEEQARSLQFLVHAVQSKYDTYIQYTSAEAQDADLKHLRSVISITLHLFEITTHLVHFYERHENDIRAENVKKHIADLVDKSAVLDRAVNFAFRGARWFMQEGKRLAERLIPAYTSIREVTYTIPEDVKLHLRPAALIANIVNYHGTPVRMRMGSDECDASSVTDVIFLAGSNVDAKAVIFLGDETPLADLKVLFDVGLYDDGHAEVQKRLPYLRR